MHHGSKCYNLGSLQLADVCFDHNLRAGSEHGASPEVWRKTESQPGELGLLVGSRAQRLL